MRQKSTAQHQNEIKEIKHCSYFNLPPDLVTSELLTFNPLQVFTTYSNEDYDRRNDDVDPMAASAEYELEKRVERLDLFPVELEKGTSCNPPLPPRKHRQSHILRGSLEPLKVSSV